MHTSRKAGEGSLCFGAALAAAAAVLLTISQVPAPARAIELFEGRVEIHGYAETQMRALSKNYDVAKELDMAQWYLIGNVELELDIAPEGFGPINLLSGYVRAEVRYDCVWTNACGMFKSVNTYGDRAERLPERLSDGHKLGFRGALGANAVRIDQAGNTQDFSDKRRLTSIPLGQDGVRFWTGPDARPVPNRNGVARLWQVPALGQIFYGQPGLDPNGVDGNKDPIVDPGLNDDDVSGCFTGSTSPFPCRYPGAYVAEDFFDYRFGLSSGRSAAGGNGVTIWGPWRPQDKIIGWASLRDRVNPYNRDEVHPVMVDENGNPLSGAGQLPFRPQAAVEADSNGDGFINGLDEVGPLESRGLYYPSTALRRAIADPNFDQPRANFSQNDLAWNHGDAQQQTRELKEAYLDIELLDHALWIRAGRQTIVWGKTELFRSQDQFNPQDLGLSSLPSLEESRIPLWALRAIYSFYDVGPLEDVRLELAGLIDEYQPLDFGRCGEPYAPPPACTVSAGLMSHGLVGIGLAGEYSPEAPWDDFHDFEYGARLEWRWDRLSFALTNYVGYPDIPNIEIMQPWQRNVDPMTGRPRRAFAGGPCVQGNEPDCLGYAVASDGTVLGGIASDFPGGPGVGDFPANVAFPTMARPYAEDTLANHHANQQVFATICASTVGLSALNSNACAFNIWNSQANVGADVGVDITLAQAFSAMLQGYGFEDSGLINGKSIYAVTTRWSTDGDLKTSADLMGDSEEDLLPLVTLHVNSNPNAGGTRTDGQAVNGFRILAFRGPGMVCDITFDCAPAPFRERGLSPTLTVEQEAILGCGDYWGTDCDIHGFDLFNSEGSAIVEAWPGFEGTSGGDWDPFDAGIAQPGTIRFRGGPVCTRWDQTTASTLTLPGCRGALDYQILNDRVNVLYETGYLAGVDGCIFAPSVGGLPVMGIYPNGDPVDLSTCAPGIGPNDVSKTLYHPFAGCLTPADEAAGLTCTFDVTRDLDSDFLAGNAQVFRSELSALSWNLMMVLVGTSTPPDVLGGSSGPNCDPMAGPKEPDGCSDRAPRFDEFDVNDPERLNGCSYRRPFLCKNVAAFLATTGPQRGTVRAGGNSAYGRRDFQWHTGAIANLDYERRNVLGFSTDFPEDVTKTNWGVEFTWFDKVIEANNDEWDGVSEVQHFNLSISVDRPTFVRFLNRGRTFLFNSQLFLRYIEGYKKGFVGPGPINATGTFLIATAYHQDRLIPTATFVHDFSSTSGALIGTLTYRYTTHFSIAVGAAGFYGDYRTVKAPLTPIVGGGGGVGEGADRAYVEPGLSTIRDRDEFFLRARYTF
ncbi:MAG: DUF1302 family protein [Myxococcota bacterium]